MKTSERGKSLIKKWEGLGPKWAKHKRIVAYRCPAGKPTIGYGHTRTVQWSDVGVRQITLEQAESLLEADLVRFEKYVSSLNLKLNQNQFDALVSAAFNLGSFGAGLTSLIRNGTFKSVPAKLKQYCHATPGSQACKGRCGVKTCRHRVEPGLITRRAEEAKLFVTEVDA